VIDQADLERIASRMRKVAQRGVFSGRESELRELYFQLCTKTVYGTNLIFTRDAGHHTSGWFKNPDYERCWHLSTSPTAQTIWARDTPELNKQLLHGWVKAFFRDHLRYVWAETPKSKEGQVAGVLHWRLFCNEHWEPIIPRSEVYSTEFTEKGWKSASELGIEIVSALNP
jgi:hypothetical protein